MWSQSYSKKVTDLTAAQVWKVWSDLNNWHSWQSDIEYTKLEGEFKVGGYFLLKPKGSPEVRIMLLEIEENRQFTDLTHFPGAKMYGRHEFIEHDNVLEIKTTMSIEGWLSFLWRKIVAENVAAGMMEQTENLLKKVRNG
jgi:hypothetical protein